MHVHVVMTVCSCGHECMFMMSVYVCRIMQHKIFLIVGILVILVIIALVIFAAVKIKQSNEGS